MSNHSARALPVFLFVFLLLASCNSNRQLTAHARSGLPLDPAGQRLIDSILQVGLDHEALYTLLGAIKPMSSLASFSFPLDDTSKHHVASGHRLSVGHQPYLDSLRRIQSALNALDLPDLRFVLTPYKRTFNGNRHIQVNVIRVSLLDSLLEAEQDFFGHFGLVPGADPGVVLNTIEYEEAYKRWRGYGYLFGYPPYAVDFFVEAGHREQTEGKFVERDFFAIPVHTRPDGSFVYATPKGYQPRRDPDSLLYFRAAETLETYRVLRHRYLNADSTLQARRLLSDFLSGKRN